MRKKGLLIVAMLLLGNILLFGQIRHVEGQKAFDIGYNLSDLGSGVSAGFIMYVGGKYSIYSSVTTDFGLAIGENSAYGVLADIGAGYNVYNFGSSLFLTAYSGLTVSYDKVANTENYDVGNGINYGLFLSPEVEYFLNDRISAGLRVPFRYLFRDAFGGTRLQGLIYLRYNL